MKTMSVFVASSINEFAMERELLKRLIGRLNNHLINENLYIKLILCEYISKAMAKGRKQEEYNDKIRTSDLFFILVGRRLGEYTHEEFEVAKTAYDFNKSPTIAGFFLWNLNDSVDPSVDKIQQELDDPSFNKCMCENTDDLVFDVAKCVIEALGTDHVLTLDGNAFLLDGELVMKLS